MIKVYKVGASICIPRVPNFFLYENGSGKIPISAVSDDSLRKIGELWTQALINRAAQQREHSGD